MKTFGLLTGFGQKLADELMARFNKILSDVAGYYGTESAKIDQARADLDGLLAQHRAKSAANGHFSTSNVPFTDSRQVAVSSTSVKFIVKVGGSRVNYYIPSKFS